MYKNFLEYVTKIIEYNNKSLELANLLASDVNFIDAMINDMADMVFQLFNISNCDEAAETFWELVHCNRTDSEAWNQFYDIFKYD